MNFIRVKFFFNILAFCIVIVLLEVILTLASAISPRVNVLLGNTSRKIFDERLGYRANPEFPDHDSNGFRNPSIPKKAAIVVFGDSQTYGTSVKFKDEWPRQLEQLSGKTIYNMAVPGYGPVQSLLLWEEASVFNPNIYIEAFYSGNDLLDSFNFVYENRQFPDLMTLDKDIEHQVKTDENRDLDVVIEKEKGRFLKRSILFVKKFLSSHVNLYHLGHQMKSLFLEQTLAKNPEWVWKDAKKYVELRSMNYEIFENKEFRTLFTPKLRLSVLDGGDIRVAEGARISLEAMKRLNTLAQQQKKEFVVVLIPTKEFVFKELVHDPSPDYLSLIAHEELLWKSTKEVLNKYNIRFIDTLPALQEQLNTGIQPYYMSHDGHPNKYGHQAIAQLIYTTLLKE